ncbi:MAG: HNH endonuclease signature motif containing protein, partial [Jatrophihabitans sp.]
ARDGGCSFPGCPTPASWCQAHHLTDYATGGPTSVNNGTLVCGHDHRERIRQGWTANLINGRVGWTPPSWIDPTREPRYNTLHRPLLT